MLTEVVNLRYQTYDILIARPSRWGNPFIIGKDGSRTEVILKYEEWIRKQPDLIAALPDLRGKRLGCFCAPKPCHGQVLISLLKEFYSDLVFD